MNRAISKHTWGRKILAIVLAAAMAFWLLQAVAPMTAYAADTTVTITGKEISAIQSEITTALGSYDTVTVTGTKTGVTNMLNFSIPEGKKVLWQAEYSGTVDGSGLILCSGALEIGAGAAIENSGGAPAIYTNQLIVSGGSVTTTASNAHSIVLSSNASVTVNGGTITGGNRGIFSERADSSVTVTVNGGAVSGYYGGIVIEGDNNALEITGGTVSSSNGRAVNIRPDDGLGSAVLTMSGGTAETTGGSYSAIFLQGNITATISGGNVIGNSVTAALSAGGSTALAITGGNFSNTGTASALVYIDQFAALYVAGSPTIAANCIDRNSSSTATGYYTGSNVGLFTSYFVAGASLFALDATPVLTQDIAGGTPYTYSSTTHAGVVVASLPAGLAITSVTATPTTATHSFSGNTVTFAGTYDTGATGLTLAVTGKLAEGKIPVSFTTAAFGVNIFAIVKTPTTVNVTAPANIIYGGTLGDPSASANAGGSTFTYSYSGTLADGSTYSPTADKPTNPGSYTVTATLVSATHTGSATSEEFYIEKKTLTWNPGTVSGSRAYDGTKSTDSYFPDNINITKSTLNGIVGDDDVGGNYPWYFDDANVGNNKTVTSGGVVMTGVDSWKYTEPYDLPTFNSTASITPAPISISTVAAPSKTYNGTSAAFLGVEDVTFSGLKNSETLVVGTDYNVLAMYTGGDYNAGSSKPYSYTIYMANTAKANNYSLAVNTASGTDGVINKAYGLTATDYDISIASADTAQHTFDLDAIVLNQSGCGTRSYTLGALTNDSTVLDGAPSLGGTNNATLSYTGNGQASGIATQAITIHTDNYTDTTVTITFTAKPTTTVTATAPANITYGNTLSDPSATANAGGSTFTYSYSGTLADGGSTVYGPTATKPTEPGSYTVTATLVSATHAGSDSATFTISKKDLSWIAGTASNKTYDGTASATVSTQPTLSGVVGSDNVTVSNGTASFASVDVANGITVIGTGYSVGGTAAWKYNMPSGQPGFGTANITAKTDTNVTDKDSYVPVSISGATAKKITDKAYTGKSIKPALVLTYKNAALKKGTDYTVSYKNNKNIGKATVTITGKGKYTGTTTITFKIIPQKASVSKVVAGKNQLKVIWKKVNAAQKITKYEVRYKIKGAAKWQTKTASAKSTNLTITKLKKGKTYQVQVQSYKTISKAKYYSEWSAVKTSGKVK